MKNRYALFFCFTEKSIQLFIRRVSVIFFIVLLQAPILIYAQRKIDPETEKQLKKDAATYFDKEDFMNAYSLYSQLLSLYPRDPNYNYRFGACMLYTNADKKKAVKYIEYGARQTAVEDLAYYYLGRALHLNYDFTKAIGSYKRFEQSAAPDELKKYPVTRLIEMCQNGKELLSTSQELDVLRKKELDFSDFFEAYNMHSNGGSLIREPDAFKTKLDKEKNVANLMYVTPDRLKAFFSSYGKDESNGKDIYVINKKPDGSWGAPENLGNVINTAFDEDYPVYDEPRHILYFCSKGHNSMGGYDIFASVYNDTTKTWSEPYNIDFPINTPGDDILLVPDTSGQTAFFASTRSSPQGKIDVYEITLHLHPPGSVVIAGTIYKAGGTTPAFGIITVRDSATNKVVVVDTTSSEDGHYSFNLPKTGKYNFTVEDSTHKGQSQAVVLAMEEAQIGIKQNIQFDASGALQIKNYPAYSKDTDSQLALQYIQNEAQMNVNTDTNSIQSLLVKKPPANSNTLVTSSANKSANPTVNLSANTNTVNSTTGNTNSTANSSANTNTVNSTTSAVKNNSATAETIIADSAKTAQLKQDEQQLNGKAAKTIDYASDEMEQAQELQEQTNATLNGNGTSGVNSDSVAAWSNESKVSAEKGIEAYQLAAEYKSEAAAKQLEIDTIENTSSSTGIGTTAQLNNQTPGNNNTNEASTASISPGNLIRQQAAQVEQDSSQLAQSNIETSREVSGLEQKSEEFITQAGQTSDSQQKVALLQQASDLSKSKEEKQGEVKDNDIELGQLHDEYTWLNSEAQKADSVSIASANKGTNTNSINPALQQEIDAYAANNKTDSSSAGNMSNNNQENTVATNGSQNPYNTTNTTNNSRHRKHFHHRNNINQVSQSGNTSVPNNNENSATAQGNNIAIHGDPNTSPGNTINNIINNSQSNNNISGNQNTQTANNNSTVSSSSGNNSSANDPPLNNNTSGNNNIPNSTNTYSTATANTNHPDSSVYYSTPNKVLLDSLASAFANVQTSNSISSGYLSNQKSFSVSTVQYTDTVSVTLYQKSQNYFAAANSIADTVKAIQNEARLEEDKNKAAVLYNKIDSLDGLIFQLNLKGDEIISKANTRQYAINANQITGINTSYSNIQSNKITTAQKMLKDADYSYTKSLSETGSANNTAVLAAKQDYTESAKKDLATAIMKQQSAVYLYFQADSAQTVNATGPSNSTDNLRFNYSDFLKTQGSSPNTFSTNNSNSANATGAQNSASESIASVKKDTNQNTGNIQNVSSGNSSENISSSSSTNAITTQSANNITTGIGSSENTSEPSSQNIPAINNNTSAGNYQPVSLSGTATVFIAATKSAYSASDPIPVDPPLPVDIEFGVQVGAFRNSIPPNLFKGFQPIIGLKAPQGYIRYTAGLFTSFDTAKTVEGKIRSLGYPGAFIVAFYKGKRITIKEALEKLGISYLPVASKTENQQTNNTTSTGTNTETSINTSIVSVGNQVATIAANTIIPSKENLIDTKRKSIRAIKDNVPPEANSLSEIRGLVFTVQVGSFSTHKGFTRLRKIKHLYFWNDPNGTIKYNSGTYNSVVDARAAKDIIVDNTSVKDAFVTAYYNGRRITIAEARSLLGNGTETTNTGTANIIPLANTSGPAIGIYKEVDSSSFALASKTKVIYTVRIASFTGPLPVDTVNKLLAYATEGIEPYKDQEGATAYYAGKFPDYAEATILQQKFFKGGFPRASIIAYYQGRKISIQEALSLTNK